MLEQQCWLWGRDVRHPGGNLLLNYGFDRARPPQGTVGASAYQLRLLADETHPRERLVALWGFGLWYGEWALDANGNLSEIGAIFLGRAEFEPRWSARVLPPSNVWSPSPLCAATRTPDSRAARRQSRLLLAGALRWIADYESWALGRLGQAERARQLDAWKQTRATPTPPAEFAPAWRALAGRLPNSRCDGEAAHRNS